MQLIWPSLESLPAYRDALERGWSPDNVRGAAAAQEELAQIAVDPSAFVESLVDREARGAPITLPDGRSIPRLPGYRRWMWDGGFCGSIGLRWQPGTSELPPHVPGHVGYAVVPWRRRRGHATAALRLLLDDARTEGLQWVDLTTDTDNIASQRVIAANGGVQMPGLRAPLLPGGPHGLRYRIVLTERA